MDNYLLNVGTNNVGGYFSSEQIDLLKIIQCNNLNDLIRFITDCDQIKHLFNEQDIISLNELDIESAKRKVFESYQNTMVLHNANPITDIENKLKNIGVMEEHIPYIKQYLSNRYIQGIRRTIESLYPDKAKDILILSHHFVSQERDQIKSSNMYDEFVVLNNNLSSFNTMLVGSGKIYSIVNSFYESNEPEYRFDFYKAKRDLDFALKNGKQVRFHSLLVKEDAHLFEDKNGKLKPKEEILTIMSEYVKHSIDFVNEYNNTHKLNGQPVINAIDLFNEIVSFDVNEQGQYYNIWESKYGITMQELMSIFDYAREHKPDGVSYLYNEPFLENDERRKKVFETLQTITSLSPGLIDTLGSQMHITITEDLGKIQRCFTDFKRLQEMTGMKIQITEFDMSLGSREILHVFGENADYTLSQVYDIKRKQIENISKIINDSGVNLSGISYWSLTDGIDCNLERLRTNLLEKGIITDINQITTACGGLIPTHQSLIKTIQMNPQLENSMSELITTSLLSSRQALEKYISEPKFQEYMKQVQEQRQLLLTRVQEMRKNNPNMSDEIFFKQVMVSFLAPVVSKVNEQYGQVIPPEKLQKLNGLINPENITFTFDKNQNDIQADSINGKLVINPQKIGGNTIEEKIVSAMGASIHESFHLLVNMLKSPEQAEKIGERLMYKVATSEGEKEVHFAPGKYGQVLSEGFVEKLSSEFAQQNGFYYTLNPSYIPCVDLCSQLMQQDRTIDSAFLFTKSGDDIVSKMSPEVKSKFEESERLFVINNFETKETKKDETLRGINSDCVISSWMERSNQVQEVKQNETFKQSFEIKREQSQQKQNVESSKITSVKGPEYNSVSFTRRSDSEINIAKQIKEKNMAIKQQKEAQRALDKPKVKTLTKSPNNGNGSSSSGRFVNTLILTLITGFIAGALFMVVYFICK